MRILFDVASLKRFEIGDEQKNPLGGTETFISYLCQGFCKLGHTVDLIAYEDRLDRLSELDFYDFVIHVTAIKTELIECGRKNIYFPHHPYCFEKTTKPLIEMDGFVFTTCESERIWGRNVRESHGFNLTKVSNENRIVIGNGWDPALFGGRNLGYDERRKDIVYCSIPNRGLDVVLDWAPDILALDDETRIVLFSDWNIYKKEGEGIRELSEHKSLSLERVILAGALPLPILAERLCSSFILFFPDTKFDETCPLSVVSAQAAGLPIITTAAGGLIPTANGQLFVSPIGRNLKHFIVKQYFLENLEFLLHSRVAWEFFHRRALETVKRQTWEYISKKWIGFLESLR